MTPIPHPVEEIAAVAIRGLNQERDFKGVYIPKEIWLTPELTGYERLIFMEVYSLDRKFGCVAKNDHFAEWLGIGERQVQDYLKRLKQKGLIEVKINKAKDTRTIRAIGHYAHVTDEQIADIGFLKKQLSKKWKLQSPRQVTRNFASAPEASGASSREIPHHSIDRHMR